VSALTASGTATVAPGGAPAVSAAAAPPEAGDVGGDQAASPNALRELLRLQLAAGTERDPQRTAERA
jgi:hypothetical protein